MENIKALRERLKKETEEWYKLCYYTGLNAKQLKYKLYNPGRFTLGEVASIKRVLQLSMEETIKIFAPKVANCNY